MQRIFYHRLTMSYGAMEQNHRFCQPKEQDVIGFCSQTETWAKANELRVVSITPVTGSVQIGNVGGVGLTMTCGFVVVFEPAKNT